MRTPVHLPVPPLPDPHEPHIIMGGDAWVKCGCGLSASLPGVVLRKPCREMDAEFPTWTYPRDAGDLPAFLRQLERLLADVATTLWYHLSVVERIAPPPPVLTGWETDLEGLLYQYLGPIQERLQGADRPNPLTEEPAR